MTDTTMTPAQLLASIKNQARRAVYDERDGMRMTQSSIAPIELHP